MPIESCLMNHSSKTKRKTLSVDCLLSYFAEQMSTASALLLVDDERKAQLDLLNKIDASGEWSFLLS